ncbi:MAG: hypothetical protein HOP29_07990 [Phycisphaerales bacterium]|nr:hypothetical protein [Phycisphaerales bacterium]
MSSETQQPRAWIDGLGVGSVLRTFKMAVHPYRLVLALAAIFLTYSWGTMLDWTWTAMDRGVRPDAVQRYLAWSSRSAGDVSGKAGVFATWRGFEVECIHNAILSVRFGRLIGTTDVGGPTVITAGMVSSDSARGVFANVVLMGRGMVWMISHHFVYAALFWGVAILIWGFFGGAICRTAAVQLARGETLGLTPALLYARDKLFGGFFMAPVIPLVICLIVGLFLAAGGLFLRIPYLGDLVGGLAFFLALFGGLIIAMVLVGGVAGGSLFWPTIAVEGSDGFDAISRSFSYVFARPVRALWYATAAITVGSFGWMLVRFVLWLALASTHLFVDFGSGTKLSHLWDAPTVESMYRMAGEAVAGGGVRFAAAAVIGLWVLPVIALPWAFLASFYLCASTAIYFLLRFDVDGTEWSELFYEEEVGDTESASSTVSAAAPHPRTAAASGGGGAKLSPPAPIENPEAGTFKTAMPDDKPSEPPTMR